jgi:pimeloyl-ACP methyl ester carboxylesterase
MDVTTGYAPADGVDVWWERRGTGGTPLVLVHGGFGVTGVFADIVDDLAVDREVVAIELQGHGHTRDVDRPFDHDAFGRQIAGVIEHLELVPADLFGYSLGGGASLRAAINHPDLLRRLVVVSFPHRREAWYPEVRAGMVNVTSAAFEQFRQSPMYAAYAAVAPDVEAFPTLMDKTGTLLVTPYDWSDAIRELAVPTMVVVGDADSIAPAQAADFFALVGGGQRDAGLDGSGVVASKLAVIPGATHYDILSSPLLVPVVRSFLD